MAFELNLCRCIIFLILIPEIAFAQSIWDGGGGGDSNINTAENWNSDTNPNFTTASWTFTGSIGLTPTINAAVTTSGITFDAFADAFTITDGAGSITLNGNIVNNDTQTQTISESILLGSASIFNTNSGDLVISGDLSGAQNLTKSGAYQLTLSGNNSYSGTTFISAGTIKSTSVTGIGSGSISMSSGTTLNLDNQSNSDWTISNNMDIQGNLHASGDGVNDTEAITITGNVQLQGSTTIENSNYGDGLTFQTGSFDLNGQALTLNASNSGSGILSIQSGISDGAGVGTVIVDTTSNVNFGGTIANSYTGNTTVNNGNLVLNKTAGTSNILGNVVLGDGVGAVNSAQLNIVNSNQISDTSAITSNADGILVVQSNVSDTIGSFAGSGRISFGGGTAGISIGNDNTSTTTSGLIYGDGYLTKVGTGTLTLSGTNTYTGITTVSGGTLKSTNSNALSSGDITVSAGGTLNLDNQSNSNWSLSNNMNLAGTLLTSGDGVNDSEAITITGNIQLQGATTVENSNLDDELNFTTGSFDLNGQALTLNASNAGTGGLGTISMQSVISDGVGGGSLVIDTTSNVTFSGTSSNTYSGTTSIQNGNLVLNRSAGVTSIAGDIVLGDGVGATNSAQLILNNNNQISDNSAITTNSDGILVVQSNVSDTIGSFAGSGRISFGGGTSGLTVGSNNSSTTASGLISGDGYLTKSGTGTLTLSGTNTYTGITTVSGGTLKSTNYNALSSGDITVSAGGTLNLDNQSNSNWSLSNNMNLAGTLLTSGDGVNDSEAITITGNIQLQGATTVENSNLDDELNFTTGSFDLNGQALTLNASNAGTGGLGTISMQSVISDGVGGGSLVIDTTSNVTFSGTSSNTYSGATSIQNGNLVLNRSAGVTSIAGDVSIGDGVGAINSARIVLSNSNQISDSIAISTNSDGTFVVQSNVTETIGSFSGSGRISFGGGTASLSIGSDNTSTTASGLISGDGSLTKVGSGTLTLSANNTYTGNTSVNAGALVINGIQSGTGDITVAPNSALYGVGSVSADIVTLSGTLSSGGGERSVGKFTMAGSNANLGGGTYVWDISDLSNGEGAGYDVLEFTAAYNLSNLDGNSLNIFIQDINSYIGPKGGTVGNKYRIMKNVTNFNEAYFNLDTNLINTVWSLSWSSTDGGSLWLSYEVVPEPGTWVMIFTLLSLILMKYFQVRNKH